MEWVEYDDPQEAVREIVRLHGVLGRIETRGELAGTESTAVLLQLIDECR